MIRGTTTLIAHIGYPTETFKAPMIYNPYFEQQGIDAVVMPMGVKADDYPQVFASLMKVTNLRGALVTMPHKVTTVGLVDEVTPTARIAGACNAVLRRPDGRIVGDMFDGAGFVRGVQRKGLELAGARALVVGCGGVGSRDRRLVGGGRRSAPSDCSMPFRRPRTVWPNACGGTIRSLTSPRVPTTPPATRSW